MTKLLDRGANTSTADRDLNTSLHYAARKGWTSITKKLMEHQSLPVAINKQGFMPLELAIHNDHNKCATFLVKSMGAERYIAISSDIKFTSLLDWYISRVRNLFQGNEMTPSKLKFHTLLEKIHMKVIHWGSCTIIIVCTCTHRGRYIHLYLKL